MSTKELMKPKKKKAPSLATILNDEATQSDETIIDEVDSTIEKVKSNISTAAFNGEKREKKEQVRIISTSVYIPEPVKEKLEEIQFSERKLKKNQNDLILEGIDLLFKKKGFPSIKKIMSET